MSDAAILAECATVRRYLPRYILIGKKGIFWEARIHFEGGQTYDDQTVTTMVNELNALVKTKGRYAKAHPEYIEDTLTGELRLTLLVKSSDTTEVCKNIERRLLEVVQTKYTEVLSVSLQVQRNGDGTIKSLKYIAYKSDELAAMMDLYDDWGMIERGQLSLTLNMNTGVGSSTSIDVMPRTKATDLEEICRTLQAATNTYIHIDYMTGH